MLVAVVIGLFVSVALGIEVVYRVVSEKYRGDATHLDLATEFLFWGLSVGGTLGVVTAYLLEWHNSFARLALLCLGSLVGTLSFGFFSERFTGSGPS